jgi:hypothetical protein
VAKKWFWVAVGAGVQPAQCGCDNNRNSDENPSSNARTPQPRCFIWSSQQPRREDPSLALHSASASVWLASPDCPLTKGLSWRSVVEGPAGAAYTETPLRQAACVVRVVIREGFLEVIVPKLTVKMGQVQRVKRTE